jgi:hypothetical protein
MGAPLVPACDHKGDTMRRIKRLLAVSAIAGIVLSVAACALPAAGPAEIPASGISGPNGGATETIYYDGMGKPHFQS